MRRVALALLSLSACSKVDPPATPAHPASASASASASPSASTAARTPITEGPPKWKTIPKQDNGFYAVLDGLCSQLTATRLGKDVVINYGGKGNSIYLGPERRGEASFIALRESGLESIGDPGITSPTGVTGRSLDDFWVADSTGSRSSEGAVLHRYVGGQWKTYPKDQTNIHAWVDGGASHVDAARTTGDRVRISIRVDAGHFFPTGDMFRRARLVVFAERADGAIVADAERVFGRTWTSKADGSRTEANDTRIRGSWSEEITLDATAPIARVRWSIIYERAVSVRPPHINLASSDVLATGDLAWN